MQIYADVTGRSLGVIGSDQGPALGSAMHAAVAAGVYPDIEAAAEKMGKLRPGMYKPRSEEHTSELQSRQYLVCRLLLEKKQTILQVALTMAMRGRALCRGRKAPSHRTVVRTQPGVSRTPLTRGVLSPLLSLPSQSHARS